MTKKQQLKAVSLLRRFAHYSEDWQDEDGTKPYYLPNGVKLRGEVASFLDRVEDEEEETPTTKKE